MTALGGGTRDCHCLNKLYEPLRRYLHEARKTVIHRFSKCWFLKFFLLKTTSYFDLLQSVQDYLPQMIFNQGMSPMHTPADTSCWCCEYVCMCVTACTVLSKLTFTIFEDPLTPSLSERPLVSINYPQCLQLPAHQVSAPIWSSRRQQAGRQGRGKCWIPVGH